jgi:hypothetical protein
MKRTLQVLALVVAGMLAAQPVSAASWGPVSSWYNDIRRSTAEGDTTKEANARVLNTFKITDNRTDGNNVYGKSTVYFRKQNIWVTGSTKSTPEVQDLGGRARTYELRWQLDPQGDRARTASRACVQLGFPVPDRCSSESLASFGY